MARQLDHSEDLSRFKRDVLFHAVLHLALDMWANTDFDNREDTERKRYHALALTMWEEANDV